LIVNQFTRRLVYVTLNFIYRWSRTMVPGWCIFSFCPVLS
jgi:hypothetical protein